MDQLHDNLHNLHEQALSREISRTLVETAHDDLVLKAPLSQVLPGGGRLNGQPGLFHATVGLQDANNIIGNEAKRSQAEHTIREPPYFILTEEHPRPTHSPQAPPAAGRKEMDTRRCTTYPSYCITALP